MTFKELNLSAPLLRAVQEAGYETPSPIQAAAIPPVLSGRDLMGCAQTGTGKTAAFALPMLDRLTANAPRRKGAIRALILTPTRELALQIGESFDAYGKYLKLRSTVIFGGVGQAPQVEALKKGVDILIACPGRLNDLIGQGFIDLSNLEIFVLDEADRMLDMGFVHDVKKVIAKLPGERQNLMFSATMPTEIEQLAAGILRKPAFVKVDPVSSTVDRIQQSLYHVEKGNKKFLLPWLIKNLQPPVVNALVFSRTKHGADKIAKDLTKQGIPAAAIHGNKSQTARVTALENFKALHVDFYFPVPVHIIGRSFQFGFHLGQERRVRVNTPHDRYRIVRLHLGDTAPHKIPDRQHRRGNEHHIIPVIMPPVGAGFGRRQLPGFFRHKILGGNVAFVAVGCHGSVLFSFQS